MLKQRMKGSKNETENQNITQNTGETEQERAIHTLYFRRNEKLFLKI